jgi:cobalamin biosynthesis Mg chelatase CobN
MKPSNSADSAYSEPANYAPSVPMTVYRELAAELRANRAVIDSLNSRNQQLLKQNQMLKQEIHNVVQATLQLGQFAGVARQAAQADNFQNMPQAFPGAIAPETLARLAETQAAAEAASAMPARQIAKQTKASSGSAAALPYNRVPRPIPQQPAKAAAKRAPNPAAKVAQSPTQGNPSAQRTVARQAAKPAATAVNGKTMAAQPSKGMTQPKPQKLFTEQSGEYRSSTLEASENNEIGGIWLALSIILIIVTAFGAGFLIMKPLLNDR